MIIESKNIYWIIKRTTRFPKAYYVYMTHPFQIELNKSANSIVSVKNLRQN